MPRKCSKPEHQNPPAHLADGRCRYCHRECDRRAKRRKSEAYKLLKQQLEAGK